MKQPIETFRGVVYPAECDAMGHLNVKGYIGFFDQAIWHSLLALGFSPELIREERIGFADVRYVIEYRRELRPGDLVRIDSAVVRVGTKSLTVQHRLFNAATGELCAELEAITAQFDLERRQAIPLIEPVRRAAAAWLAEGAG